MASIIVHGSSARKGLVKRSPREEMALRVRMLRGRHLADVYQEVLDELGDERGKQIGKVDLSRNAIKDYVHRLARAYLTPAFVEGLSPEFAGLLGDMSAKTVQARYAKIGGRPMPTRMSMVSAEIQRLRIGCNYAGTLLGWGEKSQRPYLRVITPDDLEADYLSEDPLAPTIIRHFRSRKVEGREVEVTEVYDLTDEDAPLYRIMHGQKDVTQAVLGRTFEGPDYWWRYDDGRPFHRIVISGDPREPYRSTELVEGSLRLSSGYTSCWAGMRDAGYPSRHSIGLHLDGQGSDSNTGSTGAAVGPETVANWQHNNPDQPGTFYQFQTAFNAKEAGDFLRAYHLGLVEMMGLPVDHERTGGEPTATEAAALAEAVAATYDDCRGHDSLVLRRIAAVCNRASEQTEGMAPMNIPERALACLYREEIAEALGEVQAAEDAAGQEPDPKEPTDGRP